MRLFERLYYRLHYRLGFHLDYRRRKRRRARQAVQPDIVKKGPALVIWKRPASPDLYYVFQGKNQRLTTEPLTFFRATGLLDANLVMLRDPHRFFYHAGIDDELTDLDAVRARLAACRQELPHVRRAFCLGTSMGGYAAILFGHYLKADVVYAFSPQTLLDLKVISDRSGRTDTWRFPKAHRNLTRLLADYNGHTRYKVFYCEGSVKDRLFAENIRGLGGVELCPQPGNTHRVIQEMDRSGLLSEALLDR